MSDVIGESAQLLQLLLGSNGPLLDLRDFGQARLQRGKLVRRSIHFLLEPAGERAHLVVARADLVLTALQAVLCLARHRYVVLIVEELLAQLVGLLLQLGDRARRPGQLLQVGLEPERLLQRVTHARGHAGDVGDVVRHATQLLDGGLTGLLKLPDPSPEGFHLSRQVAEPLGLLFGMLQPLIDLLLALQHLLDSLLYRRCLARCALDPLEQPLERGPFLLHLPQQLLQHLGKLLRGRLRLRFSIEEGRHTPSLLIV